MGIDQQAALSILMQLDNEVDGALTALEYADKDGKESALQALHEAQQLIETLRIVILEASDDGDAEPPAN